MSEVGIGEVEVSIEQLMAEGNPLLSGDDDPRAGLDAFRGASVEELLGGQQDAAEGGEGEQDGQAQDPSGSVETTDDLGAMPETLKFGESEVPFEDVAAAWPELVEVREAVAEAGLDWSLKEIADFGVSYGMLQQQFEAGPEEAGKVLGQLAASYLQAYGPQIPADMRTEFDVSKVDFADMDPLNKGLYSAFLAMRDQAANVARELIAMQAEAKKLSEENRQVNNAKNYVDLVKKFDPGFSGSGEDILKMMKKQGVEDPVKAYKLETYDQRTAKAREEGAAQAANQKGAPKAPGGGDKKSTLTEEQMGKMSIAEIDAWLKEHTGSPGN